MTFREKYKAEQAFSVPPELLEKTAAQMQKAEQSNVPEAPLPLEKGRENVRPHFSYKKGLGLAAAFLLVLAGAGYYDLVLKGANSADMSQAAQENALYDKAGDPGDPAENAAEVSFSTQNATMDDLADVGLGTKTMLESIEFVPESEDTASDLFWLEEIDDTAFFQTDQTVTELPVYRNAGPSLKPDGFAEDSKAAADTNRMDLAWQAAVRNGLTASSDDGASAGTSNLLQEIGVYPLRTAQEAQAALLRGEYITAVPESCGIELTDAAIKGVELTYYGGDTQELVQPAYAFYIEVDAELIQQDQTIGDTVYLRYWVPAVKSEYVQVVK